MGGKRIVILGTGYGGVRAAKLLHKRYKKNNDVEITLIGKTPYHTLMTELHEVAGGRVQPETVQINLKKIFSAKKVNVVTDDIKEVNFNSQQLISEENSYEYDYLILSTGSEPAFFGVPGVEQNGFTLWSFEDAEKVREHIINMFKKASTIKNAEKRRELLTFMVAGAGFTGIEMIGELVEWKKKLSRDYNVDENEVRLMVVEALGKVLPILNDKLSAEARRYLEKKGVEILVDSPIVKVDSKSVSLKNGIAIKTQTLIWTCGVQGTSFSSKLGLTMGKRGRIQVNEYMQSIDFDNVYVIGDNAYFEEESGPIPQIVETAMQTAETAVKNISSDIDGKAKAAFKSNYHGLMVSIGSRYCVANVAQKSLSGFIAMAIKHFVNIHYLFKVGGFNAAWYYIIHEFLDIKENRSFVGGHLSRKGHTFWTAILRVYIGVLWLIEGINKVRDGWLNPSKIFIVSTSAVSGASEAAATPAADAATSASQATAGAAAGAAAASSTPPPLLKQPPAIYKWFMDTFISPHPFIFQATVVLLEIAVGLALIAGLFTFLASLASMFLAVNFILSSMADKTILWYIFGSMAMLGGAGRAFGLDYYVMPWLKKLWLKTKLAKKSYLYIDKTSVQI